MNTSNAIDTVLATIDSEFVKALAEPARIEIIKQLILLGACDVKTLSTHMPQDRSVISRHLTMMKNAGIVTAQKEGRHVIYCIDGTSTLKKSEQLVAAIKNCLAIGCC